MIAYRGTFLHEYTDWQTVEQTDSRTKIKRSCTHKMDISDQTSKSGWRQPDEDNRFVFRNRIKLKF